MFDKNKWSEILKEPTWYEVLVPEIIAIKKSIDKGELPKEEYKEAIYSFFEEKLKKGEVALGNEVGLWDEERKPIDTIVIHHTKNPPGLTKERGSAMILVRLYATYYFKPEAEDEGIKGQPISSGHVRDGKQVFYPYHWMVKIDGSTERLLNDNEIGWQAGNWDINCRSAAICLDNNYTDSEPSGKELSAIASIIKTNYPQVSKDRIFGHREVKTNGVTECPSNKFLGQDGWKEKLLNML